jgi:parvulin-like peptidyl-prolyl isomerase
LGDSSLEEIAFDLEPGELSEPTYDESVTKGIGYWLIEVIERDENEGSHVRGILLGSRQEAEEIRAKLEADEDFATLAQEHSQHLQSKELEGDLGWLQRETTSKAIAEAAFSLEPGVISQPLADESVQTQGGYWLIKVVDKDSDRQLEDETRDTIKVQAFGDWLEEQREKSLVENYLDEEQKSWAVAQVSQDRE